MSRRFRTHYDNLKVSRDAPPEVIRSAYKALANKYHPDRNHGSERALRAMQAINTSFEALDDPVRRKAHDEWIDRKTGNAAPPQQQASAPRPQYTPPKKQPPYTHAPPPKPLFEPNIGCFYWILGFIVIGLLGSLDECSKRNSRNSDVAPAPTPTPTPTPLPSPAKPVDPIVAPFGFNWGESVERVKEVVAKAGAKVVADGRQDYQRVLVVEGIERPDLHRTIFRFINDALREVEFTYNKTDGNSSPTDIRNKWLASAQDKYGEGYRFKNTDTEADGMRKRVEGWAWVQDAGSFRLLFIKHQNGEQETERVVLAYTSTEFPPHQTVTFLTADEALAPFQVKTESGDNYLIKLVDPQTRKDVVRMYAVGGQSADFQVPLGDYEVLCASGVNWYGDELLFGPQTAYSKLDTVSRFTLSADAQTQEKLADLERKLASATNALRDYMERNKFPEKTIKYIFEGRDPQDNLQGPARLDNDWWLKNVFNKIGNNRPKLYNGLVDRLNARGRAANNYYKLMSDSGGADGVSLTLYPVRDGNLQTLPISAEDFAGGGGVP
jgi:hypothetical protein